MRFSSFLAAAALLSALFTFAAPVHAAPTIESQPRPEVKNLGDSAMFVVIADGQGPLSYQWRKDGLDLVDGPQVQGATGDALQLVDLGFGDAGAYSVIISDTSGSTASDIVNLIVEMPRAGDVDFSFDVGSSINSNVRTIAVQLDGKVLIGGSFTMVDGALRGRIARYLPDGTLDHAFGYRLSGVSSQNSIVYDIAVQSDGRILVCGAFTTVNGVVRRDLARLDNHGGLDTTFVAPSFIDASCQRVALQPDGRILVTGNFSELDDIPAERIARLNPDGSLDPTFQASTSKAFNAITVQPDGRLLVGGFFAQVNGADRPNLARLNPDGSLDGTFLNGLSGPDWGVNDITLLPDGRILIGGAFQTINGSAVDVVARLNPDGSIDSSFQNVPIEQDSGPSPPSVVDIVRQPDGRLIVTGDFDRVEGVPRSSVVRLESDGTLDTTFQNEMTGTDQGITALALDGTGRPLIGGFFQQVNGRGRRLARLNVDGSLDLAFLAGAGLDGAIPSILLEADGRMLIGGNFRAIHGEPRDFLARLHADGSVDRSFMEGIQGPNDAIIPVIRQTDGRILIGGYFTEVDGIPRGRIARLNPDGSLDESFMNGMEGANAGPMWALAVQPDGRVLAGGNFTSVNGVPRDHLVRLNPDGSLDSSFMSDVSEIGANTVVRAIAVQPDGRILIGGEFTTVHGESRSRIARLNPDGSLDPSFTAAANDYVRCFEIQPDGRILVGGKFWTMNGTYAGRFVRLMPSGEIDPTFDGSLNGANDYVVSIATQSDGRIVIGGSFDDVDGSLRQGIARLEADGSLDPSFADGLRGLTYPAVRSVVVQPDGRILTGGNFELANGSFKPFVARLYGEDPSAPAIADQPADQISYDGCCAVFRVETHGHPLEYRWFKDGVEIDDGGNVSGAATAKLTISDLTASDVGSYRVVVTNVLGTATSNLAQLTLSSLGVCEAGTCDPELGCVVGNALDGATCNDGNVCTDADSCQAGVCGSSTCACTTAPDVDGDGYGDAGSVVFRCDSSIPAGSVDNAEDCNDGSSDVYPGAAEVCDQLRNDCLASGWPMLDDSDLDTIEDACDNCANDRNPSQSDVDADQQGDVCDLNDGLIYVRFDESELRWQAELGYLLWNAYQGDLDVLRTTGSYTQPPGTNDLAGRQCGATTANWPGAGLPAPGKVAFFLVSGVNGDGESDLGEDWAGLARTNTHPCP